MNLKKSLIEELKNNNIPFLENEPMSAHTTFRVGGPAALFILPTDVEELRTALELARQAGDYLVVGKGSNLLVRDQGTGVVICTEKLNRVRSKDNTIIAEAGAMLSSISSLACEQELKGFDFAYGIPGTVGGAVVMNAGAYGGEIVDVIVSATVIDRAGKLKTLSKEELDLSYRHSCIEEMGYTVVEAVFSGEKGKREEIRTLMEEHMSSRREKQPLEYASAGSTFKRPEGSFAGKLIQDAGLKGYSVGQAAVSEKHSGFVVNYGGATADEVLSVIDHVKKTVLESSGVVLECEVKII